MNTADNRIEGRQIEQRKFRQIMDARCHLEICRLNKTGKNAMDYYIAVKTGELIGSGYQGIVAIVSNDKDLVILPFIVMFLSS